MGHVQFDRQAAGPRAAEIWSRWDRLKRHFPVWSLLPSSFYTPGAWSYLGVDFVSGFRQNRSTHQAFDIMDGADASVFDAVTALASLNARRQDQMLKAVIITYLTVPITVLALAAEIEGAGMVALARANMNLVVPIVAGLTLAPFSYFCSAWRAHQMVSVLDLIRIERGQSPYTALELRDE